MSCTIKVIYHFLTRRPYTTSSDNGDTPDQVIQMESNRLDALDSETNLSYNEEVPLVTDEEVQLSRSDEELQSSQSEEEMESSHENKIFTVNIFRQLIYV